MMNNHTSSPSIVRSVLPYVSAFGVFAVLTYAGPVLNIPIGILYPIKTVLTAGVLLFFWKEFKDEVKLVFSWSAALAGALVFLVWVLPDGLYPHIGGSAFNPYEQAHGTGVYWLMAFRLAGATLVVPVMEELFWRSFAMRFLDRTDFKAIPLGNFSWFSFVAVTIAFGFEHDRWLVGIVAGLVYGWLLCRSKNLFEPILSHAVTNLMLGFYVINTQSWSFW